MINKFFFRPATLVAPARPLAISGGASENFGWRWWRCSTATTWQLPGAK